MAQMYQTIGNNGQQAHLTVLRYVMSDKNELIYQSYPQSKQVVSAQSAYLTTYAMQRVVKNGTAKSLNKLFSSSNLAAKTGTTNDMKDSWFVGIDGKDVSVIWVGLDDHQPMGLTGASGALKIYENYLQKNRPMKLQQIQPSNIYFVGINRSGEWICGEHSVAKLPAWTVSPSLLCTGFNQVPEEQKMKNNAPNWLKDLFDF